MPTVERGTTPEGRTVMVRTALSESNMHQACGECGHDIFGQVIAKVLLVASVADSGAPAVSDWLHEVCAENRAGRLVRSSSPEVVPPMPQPAKWLEGTQRQMIEFIHKHEHTGPILVNYSYERPRDTRYHYRLAGPA